MNIADIQKFYDDNHSWNDVSKEFHISIHTISKYIKQKFLKSRSTYQTNKLKRKSFNHTQETKNKIKAARINYLKNNPDKKSWQNKGKTSIPCNIVKNLYLENNIKFIEEYQPLLHQNRFFSIDIAFPDKKIGIEINGRQHYDSNGNLTPYYQSRHDLIINEGWKLYEIPYQYAFNIERMLSLADSILKEQTCDLTFDYQKPKEFKPKKYITKHPNNVKYNYPKDDELRELAKKHRLIELCNILTIPMKQLHWHLTKRNIKCIKKQAKIREIIPRKTKIQWPSREDLQKLILVTPMTKIGKLLGVSDNAVRRHCKKHNINF